MFTRRENFIVAVLAVMLAGCASGGNMVLKDQTNDSVKQQITEGKTTEDQVRAIYGAPMTTSFTDGGNDIWHYDFSHMSADAISYVPIVNLFARSASGTKKELVILFDKDKVVQKYTLTESAVQVKSGLAN